ncbi:mrna-decapping enzyme-like protein [Quercus suber]|uniref:Mrna-decapping enzyme-like protein n=1 Tax=Quercus suber TaxID=58331 RepID=A0AAW0L7X2_QUESU
MLNLTVLQRIDPFIEEILITAAHVTFYEFNIESNQWSRKDVEGSLFVVKRNTQPRFQFIVMNRRNTDNLVENLLGDFEYEVQVPYLLYRNASQEVNGIWFYNPRECDDVANLFRYLMHIQKFLQSQKYLQAKDNLVENLLGDFEYEVQVPYLLYRNASQEVNGIWFYNPRECDDVANLFSRILNAYSKVPTKSKVSSSKSEFEELEAVPSMSLMEGPLEPSSSATDAPEDSSFRNLFNTAMNIGTPNVFFFCTPFLIGLDNAAYFFIYATAPVLHPPLNLQRPYGTPMLQPFPPPTPPLSLTPSSSPSNDGLLISRDKVRDALLMLVQRTLDSCHSPIILLQLPLSSHSSSVVSSTAPTPQVPSFLFQLHLIQPPSRHVDPIGSSNLVANLLKPSSFFAPPSSSALIMPPISSSMQLLLSFTLP